MLTVLQEALAEAHGLAIAASATVDKVERRLLDSGPRRRLDELRLDAAEARARCLDAERLFVADARAKRVFSFSSTTTDSAGKCAAI